MKKEADAMAENTTIELTEEEKLLSGNIPESVFWEFKRIAAERKENMKTAVLNAALLYIYAVSEEVKEVQSKDEQRRNSNS